MNDKRLRVDYGTYPKYNSEGENCQIFEKFLKKARYRPEESRYNLDYTELIVKDDKDNFDYYVSYSLDNGIKFSIKNTLSFDTEELSLLIGLLEPHKCSRVLACYEIQNNTNFEEAKDYFYYCITKIKFLIQEIQYFVNSYYELDFWEIVDSSIIKGPGRSLLFVKEDAHYNISAFSVPWDEVNDVLNVNWQKLTPEISFKKFELSQKIVYQFYLTTTDKKAYKEFLAFELKTKTVASKIKCFSFIDELERKMIIEEKIRKYPTKPNKWIF